MTRRDLERELVDLRERVTTADAVERPDPLTPGEKRELAEAFDVDPWARGPSDVQRALGRLQNGEGVTD